MTIIATYKNKTTKSFNDIDTLLKSMRSQDQEFNIISLCCLHINIGDEEAIAIANILKTNSTLTSLDLYYNNIGAKGAKVIADALKANTSLTSLRLGGNQIGDEGAKDFAKVLETNTSLTYLNLQFNQIGDEGAKALAKALETNTSLTYLALSQNHITDEVVQAFAEMLEKNTSITSLHLGKSISPSKIIPITDALEGNKEKILEEFNWRSLPENMQTYALKDILFKNVAECRKYANDYAHDGKDTEFLGKIYDIFTSGEFTNAEQRDSAIEDHYHVPSSDPAEWDWDGPCGAGAPEYEVFVPESESNEGRPELKCAGDVQAQLFTD